MHDGVLGLEIVAQLKGAHQDDLPFFEVQKIHLERNDLLAVVHTLREETIVFAGLPVHHGRLAIDAEGLGVDDGGDDATVVRQRLLVRSLVLSLPGLIPAGAEQIRLVLVGDLVREEVRRQVRLLLVL